MTSDNPRALAALITLEFQDLYIKWGLSQPPRTGLHASSLLVNEQEWCTRRYVLVDLFPDEALPEDFKHWQWKQQAVFENGWDLHRRWQKLFKLFAQVVYSKNAFDEVEEPELDLTHHDETRNIFFSPDAIIEFGGFRYVVEIKGIKQESYQQLTDDLQIAMLACETVYKAVFQAQLYMHLLELSYAIILVENKNTQEFKLWVIRYNKNMSVAPIQRAYDVKASIALARGNKGYPVRVCQSPDDRLARQCPMRAKCFAEQEETK